MSVALTVAVGLAGGLGAIARFLVDGLVARRSAIAFPLGTLAVNLSGAFALGVIVGASLDGDALRVAGSGLLGGYTTFSTWAFESHRLAEDGGGRVAAANFVVSLVLGVLAAWAGRRLGMAL